LTIKKVQKQKAANIKNIGCFRGFAALSHTGNKPSESSI